jgi:hypothetical protein
MPVLQLGDVYRRARGFLNDDEATNWTDYKLRNKLEHAFDELQAELVLAGIPVITSSSAIMTVPAMSLDDINVDMSSVPGYPQDMLFPIGMRERPLGDRNSDFVDMVDVDFIPNVDITTTLNYWSWEQNTILLRGALNPVQVELRYQKLLATPNVNTDSIIVPLAQLFLAPRTAALAYDSLGNRQRRDDLTIMSSANLDKIIRMNIKQLQDMPAKRKPYHRGRGTLGQL